jgi:predicted component of type VI protein secretion system
MLPCRAAWYTIRSTFSIPSSGVQVGDPMPAQLLALTEGPSILVDKPILLVGRHPECDIQVDSRKISRRHCCIAQINDYLVVRDLGSTNGIRINGVRVLEGTLKNGDELTIGNNRYQLRGHEAEPPAIAPRKGSKDPFHPAPRPELADDMLEDCEDPIALADEDEESLPKARPAGPAPARLPGREPVAPPVLPDKLELAPISDVLKQDPSPSHPGT